MDHTDRPDLHPGTLALHRVTIRLALLWFIVNYGIAHWGTSHPGAPPPNLADAFTAGADGIIMALLRPLVGGNGAPPGLIGRIVIAVALAIGYRMLEWRARQLQAPQQPGWQPELANDCNVTVYPENPRNGDTIATRTLAGQDVDDATSRVAGFVARQIFVNDPDTPPWCYGRADGADLGALLLARQVRTQAENPGANTWARSARTPGTWQPFAVTAP